MKKGFTLAEVLITLAVIGVVAKSYEGRQEGIDNKAYCMNHYFGGHCFDYIKNNGWVMDY